MKLFLSRNTFFTGCVISLLVIMAYWVALSGPMVLDDYHNIVNNPKVAIDDLSYDALKGALLSNESGRLKRVLPALSFGLNYYMAGSFDDTLSFKVFNLVIHLFNSTLVFWLAYHLWPRLQRTRSKACQQKTAFRFATLITLIWVLHPLQLSSVIYVVQRMTSMSALFVLLGLCGYIYGREQLEQGANKGIRIMTLSVLGGTFLGLLCKENAALLILYAGVIEVTLFSRKGLSVEQKRSLNRFYIIVLLIPVLLGVFYVFFYSNVLAGFAFRPFTLFERGLTESRVLWFYLTMLLVPDITTMGLVHDDFVTSTDWLQPITTLYSISAWVALVIIALVLRKSLPVLAFAVFWFLAGHSLESTVLPLELIFEHRNYVAILGPIMLFVWLGFALVSWLFSMLKDKHPSNSLLPLAIKTGVSGLLVFMLGSLLVLTYARANNWRSLESFIISHVNNHPYSATAQYQLGEWLNRSQHKPKDAFPHYLSAAQLNPNEVGFLISASMATPLNATDRLKLDGFYKLVDPYFIALVLEHKPVSSWGFKSLSVAARCVKDKIPDCKRHIESVRQWLNAMLNSPFTGASDRRVLTRALFEIEMKYRQYSNALATATKASDKDKHYLRYLLMQSNALMAMGHYQQALKTLQQAETAATNATNSMPLFISDITNMRKLILHKL